MLRSRGSDPPEALEGLGGQKHRRISTSGNPRSSSPPTSSPLPMILLLRFWKMGRVIQNQPQDHNISAYDKDSRDDHQVYDSLTCHIVSLSIFMLEPKRPKCCITFWEKLFWVTLMGKKTSFWNLFDSTSVEEVSFFFSFSCATPLFYQWNLFHEILTREICSFFFPSLCYSQLALL